MERFEGRTVIVTGAGSGIGAEMARRFAAEGAVVFAADLSVASIPEGCEAFQADVSQEPDVARLVESAVTATGRLDVICNNAGLSSTADPLTCSVEEWDQVFAVNARGVFLGTKHALPQMLKQKKGSIVNTASVAGLVGFKDRAAYCASKGAVISFTKSVAVQYAGTGVRCNCLCPGTVDSPWVQRLLEKADDPDQMRAELVARQPMGRLGEPWEIAAAALYLASDDADYVSGTALVIDGGLAAG